MEARPIDTIPPSELIMHPVWEFQPEDQSRDETWVLPVKRLPVTSLPNRIVAVLARLGNGTLVTAMIENISLSNPRSTRQFQRVSIAKDDCWFHLARYFDIDREGREPADLARFLGLSLEDVFPISYDLTGIAVGLPEVVQGTISAEPEERLRDQERMAMVFEDMAQNKMD